MSVPSGPPKSQSGFNEGYAASSCSSVHSVSLGPDPMIFCQYCGWRANNSPPRCAYCPTRRDLKQRNLQSSLKMDPYISHATSESLQNLLMGSSSLDPPGPNSHPSSLQNEPDGSKMKPQSQNSPVSSNSVSLQPADRFPASYPINHYLTSTLEKPACLQKSSLPAQQHRSDQETLIRHTCRFCKLTFKAFYLLHHHIETGHKHRCNTCPRVFNRGLQLAQHQAYTHLPHPCNQICAASSKPGPAQTTSSSGVHMTKKTIRQSLICQTCSRNFRSPRTFQKHRCNPLQVQCTSCGKYFGGKVLLRKHSNQNNCDSAWRRREETETKVFSPLDRGQADSPAYLLPQRDSSSIQHSSCDTKTPISDSKGVQ